MLFRLIVVLLLAFGSAHAQLFSDGEVRQRSLENEKSIENFKEVIQLLNASLQSLKEKEALTRKQMTSMSQKQQAVDERVRTLRGEVEELQEIFLQQSNSDSDKENRALENLKKEVQELAEVQKALSADINEISGYVTLPSEEEIYLAAVEQFQNRNFKEAISGFSKVIRLYEEGKFATNAHYWLARSYLLTEDYSQAEVISRQIIDSPKSGDKRAEAMLVLAKALLGKEKLDEGEGVLQSLIKQYPTSFAADEARQLLTQ